MFGGADNDGIDVGKLIHQFPKIRVTTCQCVSFCGFVDMRLIDVAQCCDMDRTAIVQFAKVGTSPPTDTHKGYVDLVVLRPASFSRAERTGSNSSPTHRLKKPPPGMVGIEHDCSRVQKMRHE